MTDRILFSGGRDRARNVVLQFVGALAGKANQYRDAAKGVFTVVGLTAMSDIQRDFVRKARGETGEDGVRWPPLKPKTLAYGRRAPRGRGHAPGGKDGLLTRAQLKRWQQIFGSRLGRFAMSMPLGEAKAKAAQIAWATIKAEGGQTKIEAYAKRPHEILRDTGALLNSLSPGQVGDDARNVSVSTPDGQVFDVRPAGVIVGTNVPYAATHQNGDAKRGIPARPFIPARVPDRWLLRWVTAAARSSEQQLSRAIREAA